MFFTWLAGHPTVAPRIIRIAAIKKPPVGSSRENKN